MARQVRGQNPTKYSYLLTEKVGKEQAILVGGQAVNFWALLFVDDEPELEQFKPFTSKDCDVIASTEWTRRIADEHGLKWQTFRAGQASLAVGIIFVPMGNKQTTELQVLRGVTGLRPKEIEEAVSKVQFDGKLYQVIDPIALLKSKLNSIRRFDQDDRQDLKHVLILCSCVRVYLKLRLNELQNNKITARNCTNSLEAALSVVLSKDAMRVSGDHGINFNKVFPEKQLSRIRDMAIKNFINKRLPSMGVNL